MGKLIVTILVILLIAIVLIYTFWPLFLILLALVIGISIYKQQKYIKTPAEEQWAKWSDTFASNAQRTRYDRAVNDELTVASIDREKKVAKIIGHSSKQYKTTLLKCTCPDFSERKVPCKHMYRLANELGLEHIHKGK